MSAKDRRISESTVARIAGNITAGLVGREAFTMSAFATDDEVEQIERTVARVSVRLARAIVAEVERTVKEQA